MRTTFLMAIFAFPLITDGFQKGEVCWPLHFAGITVGVNTDSQVRRLLGDGLFRANEGFEGRRVFVDIKHTATLHTVSYTDGIVGELSISAGSGGLASGELKKAETQYFDASDGFGNGGALTLGSTEAQVRDNLGAPQSKTRSGGWTYTTKCACELLEYFTVYFKNGRIDKIVLSAPPG
jgi:hypothetical protein